MRRLPAFVLALFIAVAAIGCDSEEDESEAELFIGTWQLVEINDDEGDQTEGFTDLANSLSVTLNSDNSFELLLDYKDDSGRTDVPLEGTYTVDEGANSLVLTVPAIQNSIDFDYDFDNDEEVTLSARADIINILFNPVTPYEGTVDVVIRKQ